MTMIIKCNNKPRPIIYGFELSDKQKVDFNYLGENINENRFFMYKNEIYDINDFMRVCDLHNNPFSGYHGYISESFFSGILIKLCDNSDYIIVARYYS